MEGKGTRKQGTTGSGITEEGNEYEYNMVVCLCAHVP